MRTRIRVSSVALVAALLVAPGLALAGQGQPKYGASVKASKPAELAKAKTYRWTVSQPSFNKDADKQIIAAVDRELQARGLTKSSAGPADLVVTYASISRTDVDLKSKGKEGELKEFSVGTLVVDVRDGANKTVALPGAHGQAGRERARQARGGDQRRGRRDVRKIPQRRRREEIGKRSARTRESGSTRRSR